MPLHRQTDVLGTTVFVIVAVGWIYYVMYQASTPTSMLEEIGCTCKSRGKFLWECKGKIHMREMEWTNVAGTTADWEYNIPVTFSITFTRSHNNLVLWSRASTYYRIFFCSSSVELHERFRIIFRHTVLYRTWDSRCALNCYIRSTRPWLGFK